jgi:hypothetical protein
MNFWAPRPEAQKPQEAPTKPNRKVQLNPVIYKGQLYQFVIDAPDTAHAAGAFGALLKAILTSPKAQKAFEQQSIFTRPILGPTTEIVLGETKLYAKAGSLKPDLAAAMAIDRLAFALTECRGTDSQVEKMIETVGLRIVTRT